MHAQKGVAAIATSSWAIRPRWLLRCVLSSRSQLGIGVRFSRAPAVVPTFRAQFDSRRPNPVSEDSPLAAVEDTVLVLSVLPKTWAEGALGARLHLTIT